MDCGRADAGAVVVVERILAGRQIGWAYPLTSLAYPLTMILAAVVLAERYDWHVWVGAVLISAGAAVIGPPMRTSLLPRGVCDGEVEVGGSDARRSDGVLLHGCLPWADR